MPTYDPKLIIATFNGVLITGYADGSFIKAAREVATYTKVTGAGGEVARVRSRNRSASVTFTLMQTSPCNDLLSAIAAQDEIANTGVGPLQIKDGNGTSLLHAPNAWITKPADVEEGKELTNREWQIDCDSLDMLVGGNV